MLASDFGAISGLVYRDATGNGFTAGEEVVGATINCYTDDGDGVFEPGTGDTLSGTDTTDAAGLYRFDGLSAGSYWIEQPAQTVGAVLLSAQNSSLITISSLEAQGTAGTTIDDYTDTGPSITASGPAPNSSFGNVAAPNVLGAERDLFVELVTGLAGENVQLNGSAGALTYSATTAAVGRYVSVWDGADGDASAIDFTGLGGQDLTSGGAATAIRILASADLSGATARLRVYTDANNWSEQSISIPAGSNNELVFRFTSFSQGGGATGPAVFTNVGAVELQIDTTNAGTDGDVTLVELLQPTVKSQDFTNPADLSLTKTVDNAAPTIGQNVTFTITVSNAGPGAANNVVVADLLPAGLTFVSSNPSQGSYVSGTGVWTVGNIDAGDSATLEIVATATSGASQDNDAEVTDVDEFDPDSTPNNNVPTEDDQDSANVDATSVDLSVTKIVNDNTPGRNQNVTFTITVANAGPDNATGVVVNDDLPAGMTFVSATPSQGTYDSGTGLWTVGTVNSSASATLDIVATVTTSTPKTNTAELTAADQGDVDSTPNNGQSGEDDQASVTLTPTIADVSVTKTVDDATPDKNQNVVFTITVANGGPDAATGVAVTDQLPSGLTFVSAVPSQGTYDSGTGVWTVGTVNSATSATLTLTATVTTIGAKINTAELTALTEFDSDSTPNNAVGSEDDQASVTLTPTVADLSITKTVDDSTPNRNQNVVYTVTVTNGGPDTATGVTITDLLQSGLTFVSATPSQGTYDQTTGVWTVGSINSAGTATLTVTATVTTSAAKTNTAQVTAVNQFDSDSTPNNNVGTEDDQASATVTPNVADLSVTKTVDDATPNPNQNLTFTITVANGGPQQATTVSLTDQLPAGLTFVSATPSQGTYDQGTGVWTIGSINSAASVTLTIIATNTTAAAKTNTARLTTSDQFDNDSTPGNSVAGEDDESTITITPNVADVRLSKTVSSASPQLGQNVTFTITATNDGPQAASGLTVTDQLPAGFTFVSATPSVGTYNQATGLWTIGALNSGANATLTIVATASQIGSATNTAQVTAQTEFDTDSTPNNSVGTEDDQASVTVNTTQLISPRLCTVVWHRT